MTCVFFSFSVKTGESSIALLFHFLLLLLLCFVLLVFFFYLLALGRGEKDHEFSFGH